MVRRRSSRRPRLADLFAAHQAGAHDAGEPRRERVRRRNLFGIDDMAQVGAREIFDTRRALAAAPALGPRFTVAVALSLDAIRQAERFLRHMSFGELFSGRRVACARHAGENLPLPHAAALPEGVKDLVETFPVGMRGAKQRAQCRLERCRAERRRRRQHLQRVARLGEPDPETVVAQRVREAGETATGAERGHHATLPRRRSLTSRVSRARSSWVLSRQIMVS